MRGITCAIKGAMLGGMILVLSSGTALAFGDNKVVDEKAKAEINKVEKAKLQDKKADEHVVMEMKAKSDSGVLLENARLREGILGEGILGEGLLGIEE